MADVGNFAAGGLQRSYSFDRFHADIIPASTVFVRCPDMACEQINIQNDPSSANNITIGSERLGEDGSGWVLQPGDATGWIPINNLNLVYHIDGASSHLNYMMFR